MTTQKIRAGLIFILAAAFILRMTLILTLKTYARARGWEYETIANNLVAGKGYSFEFLNTTYWSFNTPLFGYLCAGVYAVTNHSHFAILVLQSCFTIALAFVIFRIAKLLFSENVGLLAAALAAFHPGFIYYDIFNLLPLSLDSFLIAAITLLLLKHKDKPTLASMLSIGALIGIATLSRGITGMLLVFVLGYIFLFAKNLDFKARLTMALCVACATFIVLLPWIIRNYCIHRQFVFVSTSSENLWRGNNSLATGTSYDQHQVRIRDLLPPDIQEKVYAMPEMQQQEFFKTDALRFIRTNPLAAATLYVKKVYYFWWFSPASGTLYPKRYLAAYKYCYAILISFFVAGVWLALASANKQRLEPYSILLAVPLTICLTQSVFYVEGRHRWLVEPLIMIFSAYAMLRLWQVIKRKLSSSAHAPQ